MEFYTHTLANKIRLIHVPTDSDVAYCGVIVNTGSRDEETHEQGMAHFLEHIIFKGTKKRKAYHILSRLEDVGGEINAYTTKEETCIHAAFLSRYYERTLELFSDLIFNSTFPAKEVEKEKEVIIDEINSYLDSPSERIFDEFEEVIFENHPLGSNILGTKENVKRFQEKDIRQFIKKNYHTDEIVICSLGNIPFNKLIKQVESYFGHARTYLRDTKRKSFKGYKPQYIQKNLNTHQSHCVIGGLGFGLNNKKRVDLTLLNNILGGPGMNSRLNLALREKNGIAYNIESHYTPFTDTGNIQIYFGTESENLERGITLVNKELKLLRTKKLGTIQLQKAKRQLAGQVAISNDNNENHLLGIGKSFLLFNKVDSLEDMNKKIDSITAESLLEVANEIFEEKQLTTLIYI